MPVCVQIVGGRFGEEKTVAVAKVLDQLLGYDKSPFHARPV
jgi:amidase